MEETMLYIASPTATIIDRFNGLLFIPTADQAAQAMASEAGYVPLSPTDPRRGAILRKAWSHAYGTGPIDQNQQGAN